MEYFQLQQQLATLNDSCWGMSVKQADDENYISSLCMQLRNALQREDQVTDHGLG